MHRNAKGQFCGLDNINMDSPKSAESREKAMNQVTKEIYLIFKDHYDAKVWMSYPLWENLTKKDKEFWLSFAHVVSNKVDEV